MKGRLFILTIMAAITVATAGTDKAMANSTDLDARTIMQRAFDRDDGRTQVSAQKLSTCRYAMKGKNLVCAEKPRVKKFESIKKDYGPNEKDTRSVSILVEPPAERGIGFLQYDYEDENKDADQWMYLSAFGKVKRIVSGNENEPKEGSFFGSEFGYEDMERPHLDDYTYQLLKEEEVYQGRPCWVVESLPTPKQARKSNYSRSISWIDKERLLTLKSIVYNRQGKRAKRITMRKVKQIDGVWVAMQVNVNNLISKRMSTIKFSHIAINVDVDDSFLTLRTLTDGAFRERHMKTYRNTLQ